MNLRSAEIKSVAGTAFFRGGWGVAPCRQTKTRWRARFRPRRLLGYSGREVAACKNDVYFQTDQLGGELGKLLGASLSVAELDGDVLAIDEIRRAQSLPKRLHPG